MAGSNPQTASEFAKIRNFPGGKDGKLVAPVLTILLKVAAMPDTALPTPLSNSQIKKPPAAVMELLRVLLKHVTDEQNIAPRLIASADDLELLARDNNAPIPALSGWRREVFGATALQLKNGKIALAVENGHIRLIANNGPSA